MKVRMFATTVNGNKIPVPVIAVSKELGVQQAFYIDKMRPKFIQGSYVVVHIPTGLRVCHTYFTEVEAVVLAKELSTLSEWSKIDNRTDPREEGYGTRNKAAVGKRFLAQLERIVEKHANASRRYEDEELLTPNGKHWRI